MGSTSGDATSTNGSSTNGSSSSSPAKRRARKWGRKQRLIRERLNAYRKSKRAERPPRKPEVAVPSFFTLMNLFCGFLAITQVIDGDLVQAGLLIILAGFFDALDGFMARLTDASSPFGVELDSLSDIVSFGVAPGMLVYMFGLNEFGPLGLVIASLPALCGAVRLARFNVNFQGEKRDYFTGLPIPAQAITIVALVLVLSNAVWYEPGQAGHLSVLVPVVLLLSGLMVSAVRFDGIPRPSIDYMRQHPRRSLLYAGLIVLLPFFREHVLLLFLTGYIVHGIGVSAFRVVRAVMETPVDSPESQQEGT